MSCGAENDVIHFEGDPQRCLNCLSQLRVRMLDETRVQCIQCRLRYSIEVLIWSGTERILTQPDRFHIARGEALHDGDLEPYVIITDLDHARSVLAVRGDL